MVQVTAWTVNGVEVRTGCDYCKLVSKKPCEGLDGHHGGFCGQCARFGKQCQWTPIGTAHPTKEQIKGDAPYTPPSNLIVPTLPTKELAKWEEAATKTVDKANKGKTRLPRDRRPSNQRAVHGSGDQSDDASSGLSDVPSEDEASARVDFKKRASTSKRSSKHDDFLLPRNHSLPKPPVKQDEFVEGVSSSKRIPKRAGFEQPHNQSISESPAEPAAASSSKRAPEHSASDAGPIRKKIRTDEGSEAGPSIRKASRPEKGNARNGGKPQQATVAPDEALYKQVQEEHRSAAQTIENRKSGRALTHEQKLGSGAVIVNGKARYYQSDGPKAAAERNKDYLGGSLVKSDVKPREDKAKGIPSRKNKHVVVSDEESEADEPMPGPSSPRKGSTRETRIELPEDDVDLARRLDGKYPSEAQSGTKRSNADKQQGDGEKPRLKLVNRQKGEQSSAASEPRLALKKRVLDDVRDSGTATPALTDGESDPQSKRIPARKVQAAPPRKDALQNLFAALPGSAAAAGSPSTDSKRPSVKLPMTDASKKREEAAKKREEIYASQPILDIMAPAALIKRFEKSRDYFRGRYDLKEAQTVSGKQTSEIIAAILKTNESTSAMAA